MSRENGKPDAWAVLIGVNYYGDKVGALHGCVQDVQKQRQFLMKQGVQRIEEFIVGSPPNSTSIVSSGDSKLPTFDNVTTSLKEIAAKAQHGDFVYVHFSGHGTQELEDNRTYNHRGTGDLALVLFDTLTGVRYLRGAELAALLGSMVTKGLFVTLVLDCCFSGSVRRQGQDRPSIRTTRYDPMISAAHPLDVSLISNQRDRSGTLRDATKLSISILDPAGYTILAACGPDELAEELRFSDGQRSGALSHFLLRALKSQKGIDISIASLYNHLRLKFSVYWPQQTPMCYGRRDVSFLGHLVSEESAGFVTAVKRQEDDRLYLDAGLAQGVCQDDEYALYAMAVVEEVNIRPIQPSFHARVSKLEATRSELMKTSICSETDKTETRWKAKSLALSSRKVSIHLAMGDQHRQLFPPILHKKRFVEVPSDTEDPSSTLFTVSLNDCDEYQILDHSCHPITTLPTIPCANPQAVQITGSLLEHVAQFKYIQAMENLTPVAAFEQSFAMHIKGPEGQNTQAGDVLLVGHRDKIKLNIENLSDMPLYIAILDLRPEWQVCSIPREHGSLNSTEFLKVTPKKPAEQGRPAYTGRLKQSMRMKIPESFMSRGWDQCEDILKIFVTNMGTSFSPLYLPAIPASLGEIDGPIRGDGGNPELSSFLSAFATPFRGDDSALRNNYWTTRTFTVRTIRTKD